MLFNSVSFLIFFAIVYPTYLALPMRWQNRLLILAGYVFYGWWDVRFLFLLVVSTGLDFCCGLMLGTGTVPARSRLTVSGVLIAAALGFTVPDWSGLRWADAGSTASASWAIEADWPKLLPVAPRAWSVAIGTAAVVVLANLLYAGLVALPEARRRKVSIVLTIAANLAFLGFFKYFNFFIGSAEVLLRKLGVTQSFPLLQVALPVGISFYTFQSMSYTIDVYRGKFPPVRRFWDYATFVSFFPPLVAGPIERASQLLPQLVRERRPDLRGVSEGLYLILFGFFKKVAVADGLAGSVTSVFGSAGHPSVLDAWAASLLFAFQIYCDFSGYTDIARGVAKLLGVELVLNFNLPYVSRGPSEFWGRWHISLSSWLRDYLYIPLGGNRLGSAKTYRNLLLTMLLGGLWHGAAWNYVLWGLYHGLVLCAYRAAGSLRAEKLEDRKAPPRPASRAVGLLQWALFFGLTCYGWMLFRAVSLAQVVEFTTTMFGGRGFGGGLAMTTPRLPGIVGLAMLVGYEAVAFAAGSTEFYRRLPSPVRGAWYAALAYLILMGMSNEPTQFIYFQF